VIDRLDQTAPLLQKAIDQFVRDRLSIRVEVHDLDHLEVLEGNGVRNEVSGHGRLQRKRGSARGEPAEPMSM
jgi:hypothetical protein